MINEWRLAQFKSVGEQTTLQLRPLTIFAGSNSSGKSTVLQSMLLICQTLASKVSNRQIVLNGELLKLGTFFDVLTDESTTEEIGIGFSIETDLSKVERDWKFASPRRTHGYYYPGDLPFIGAFRLDLRYAPRKQAADDTPRKSLSLQGQLERADFALNLESLDPKAQSSQPFGDGPYKMSLRRRSEDEKAKLAATLTSDPRRFLVETEDLDYEVHNLPDDATWHRHYPFRPFAFDSKSCIGAKLEHFLPGVFVTKFSMMRRRIWEVLWEYGSRSEPDLSASRDPVELAVNEGLKRLSGSEKQQVKDGLRRLRTEAHAGTKPSQDQSRLQLLVETAFSLLNPEIRSTSAIEYMPPPSFIEIFNSAVDVTFSKLRYLGPLRDDPKALYSIPGSADPTHIGYKGEFTAAVLDLYGNTHVDFVHPAGTDVTRMPLKDAVRAWLKHFGIADGCFAREEGKLGHRLYIRSSNIHKELDLTNVGVGVSQVLPIIVMSLISAPGATLLFEQPELHLHPKVQALLADFFLALTKTGRQCIVETHSEYLVNRLRLRVAESPWGSPLKDQIMIYFVELLGSSSNFVPVTVNDFGAVPDWPSGFFDQGPSESDRILFAAAKKRKTQSAKR